MRGAAAPSWHFCLLSILGSLLVLTGAACDLSPARSKFEREQQVPYAELPGLRATDHANLRGEMLRLVDERATPNLLNVRQVPAERNVAVALGEIFEGRAPLYEAAEQAKSIAQEGLPLTGAALERGERCLQLYTRQRLRALGALRQPECELGIDTSQGSLADLSTLDTVRFFARLEAFAASQSIAGDRLDDAVESIGHMLRYAACQANEPHVVARLEGAFTRREALSLVEAAVRHPSSTTSQRQRLYELLRRQLADLPHDAQAWIGDRALGLHTYEVVRAGHVKKLIADEEANRLRGEGWLARLETPVDTELDEDEWFYLRSMRRIIEACEQPYFEREELFAKLYGDLHERRNDDDFPIVAARLLLSDVQAGHQHQARDRAACEAWALALAAALDQDLPPFETNPLTGTPYQVVQEAKRVLVWPVGTDEPDDFQAIEIPRHGGDEP